MTQDKSQHFSSPTHPCWIMTISSWLHVPDNNSDDVRAILNSESWLDAGVSQRHEQNFQMNLSQTCTALKLEQEPERTRAAHYTIRVSPARPCPSSAARNDLRIYKLPFGAPQTPSKLGLPRGYHLGWTQICQHLPLHKAWKVNATPTTQITKSMDISLTTTVAADGGCKARIKWVGMGHVSGRLWSKYTCRESRQGAWPQAAPDLSARQTREETKS